MTSLRKKHVSIQFMLSLCLALASAGAHAGGKPKPVVGGPIGKVRVMWQGDASTTATIGIATAAAPSANLKLHYDTVDHGTDAAAYAFTRPLDAKVVAKGMNNGFFRLRELTPATAYYFMVSDGATATARYWFRSAPGAGASRLSIIAGGDSRNNATPRRAANSLVAKLRPDAVLFGGDMTSSGSDSQWAEWFEDWQLSISADGRVTPLVMTRGNHESNNDVMVQLFDTNANVYYATSMGGNLFRAYTLNSETSIGGAQTDWLRADLAANANAVWKVAQYHKPMRPHVASKSDGTNQYRYWAPLFDQFGMDVVVECDAHTVKQTWPIRASSGSGSSDGFVRDDVNGVVYVGEGGWGAPLRDNDKVRAWTRDSAKFNHFQWMLITPREMELRTVRVDNAALVSALTEDNRFSIPNGLDVWNPGNGSVVRLAK